jgi:hypothetical protein
MIEWCTKFEACYKDLEGLIVNRDVTEENLQGMLDDIKKNRTQYLQFDSFARTLKPRTAKPKAQFKAKAKP